MGAVNMMKRKVCVVITTRGNCAKMNPVMKSICQHPKLELQVIVEENTRKKELKFLKRLKRIRLLRFAPLVR